MIFKIWFISFCSKILSFIQIFKIDDLNIFCYSKKYLFNFVFIIGDLEVNISPNNPHLNLRSYAEEFAARAHVRFTSIPYSHL